MCLISFAYQAGGETPFLLAANRDEFHERPTLPAGYWPDAPHVLGGRDLRGGGSWFALTTNGRIAMLTNFREGRKENPDAPSRGELVSRFVLEDMSPAQYLEQLIENGPAYNGFNLVFGYYHQLWYFSNRGGTPGRLEGGTYGLSNHLLNTPWPKVNIARNVVQASPKQKRVDMKALGEAFYDTREAPDHLLPDTGVGIEWERILSPVFISGDTYGSRATTLLRISKTGKVEFKEITFAPKGKWISEVYHTFELPVEETQLVKET